MDTLRKQDATLPPATIPVGFCQCGCGKKTKIAIKTSTRLGNRKGQPQRFIHGHNAKRIVPLPPALCQCGCGQTTAIRAHTETTRNMLQGTPARFLPGHNSRKRPVLVEAVPFKIDGEPCRLIPLTMGQYAIVDAGLYADLMQWKWCASKCPTGFYARRTICVNHKQSDIRMHAYILGASGGLRPDHRNGIGIDNRRSNLRLATPMENTRNKAKTTKGTTSRYKGVTWSTNKWSCEIKVNKIGIRLGRFESEEEAAKVYDEAALKYFGEFARLNFPREQK